MFYFRSEREKIPASGSSRQQDLVPNPAAGVPK
jgi:hypothetical protein